MWRFEAKAKVLVEFELYLDRCSTGYIHDMMIKRSSQMVAFPNELAI